MNERDTMLLEMLASGIRAKEIGLAMAISKRTVEKRIEILKFAYGAKNAPHLIAIAFRKKLIQ